MLSQFRSKYGILKLLSEPPQWLVSRFTNYRHLSTGGGGSGFVRVFSFLMLLGYESFNFGMVQTAKLERAFVVASGTCSALTENFISHCFDLEEGVRFGVECSDTIAIQCVLWFVY